MKWLWAIIDALRTFFKDVREANAAVGAEQRAAKTAQRATAAAAQEQHAAEQANAAELAKADPAKPAAQAVDDFINAFHGKGE